MSQGRLFCCSIVLLVLVNFSDGFDVFLSKTLNFSSTNKEPLSNFQNKAYEIPLFQTRYITVRARHNDIRSPTANVKVIGFKFQVTSSNPKIVEVNKTSNFFSGRTEVGATVLQEDLYILSSPKALKSILNAYPSPTLVRLNRTATDDELIDSTWMIKSAWMDVTILNIRLDVFYDDDSAATYQWPLKILVTQPKRTVDTMFYVLIPFIVIGISILMGVLLDTRVIYDIVKNPTAVLVGFVAQYGLMPFLAMAIAKLFHYTPLNSLALFVIGCCPGSGASNQWTVIFDGDVNLSAVMSFVSTATSFIMMPLYFYTLGKLYMDELSIKVPFLGLARSLALVVIPYSIGIGISHLAPNSRDFVRRMIKPIMIVLLLFFSTFGLIVNWYLFVAIDLYTALTAPLLPFLGFLIGGFLAWVSRRNWAEIKTIGIEAGIQNVGIAFMIIMYSFPQPYATQALIVPIVVSLLTTKPFWLILIIRNQIRKYQKRKAAEKSPVADGKLVLTSDKTLPSNGDHRSEQLQQL